MPKKLLRQHTHIHADRVVQAKRTHHHHHHYQHQRNCIRNMHHQKMGSGNTHTPTTTIASTIGAALRQHHKNCSGNTHKTRTKSPPFPLLIFLPHLCPPPSRSAYPPLVLGFGVLHLLQMSRLAKLWLLQSGQSQSPGRRVRDGNSPRGGKSS